MVQRVILDGLWCGQGMANMVRVFKDSAADPNKTPADWLCVFDFGSGGLSASKKVLGITPPVKYIMDQLKLQQKAGRTPRIELMLISHQDRDHWQLLGELNVQIVQDGMTVEIGYVLLAGTNWRLSSKTAVLKFVARAQGRYVWYDGQYSSYSDPKNPGAPITIGDMAMRMLVTNVATNSSGEDIERNCSSACVLLQLGQLSFILPGDATWETFAQLKLIMENWPKNPLPYVYAASVPHHGALRTMNRNTSGSPDLQDLVWFTGYTRPTSIFASAGINNTHSHPYFIVLETMGRFTSAEQFQPHPTVVFNGSTDKFELIPNVRKNIYTTVLNLTTPAKTANWVFNITPTDHSTGIQLFEAGVPGILSAPELSEMELAAQRAGTHDVDMDGTAAKTTGGDFVRGPVRWGPTVRSTGGAPAAASEFAPVPWSANRAPPVRAYHLPQPTAGAARSEHPRPPPPRRVRAGPTAVLSPSG